MSSRLPHLALFAALAGAAGCHVHHDEGCYDCGPTVYYEQEPNDSATSPDVIGGVAPGDHLLIEGHVTQFGPDLFDGFAFHAQAPCDVEVLLWIDDPHVDLDLCVYDPQLGQYVVCYETSNNPEGGGFTLGEGGKPFHLVVSSFSGASAYTLEVVVRHPTYAGSAAPGPSSASGEAGAGAAHRPGMESHWQGYLRAPEEEAAVPVGLPARLITLDPLTGELRSEPARLVPTPRG